MFEDMSSEDKYNLGLLVGQSIASLFDIIAQLDNITVEEAVERWIESYIAEKIIEAAEEDTNG